MESPVDATARAVATSTHSDPISPASDHTSDADHQLEQLPQELTQHLTESLAEQPSQGSSPSGSPYNAEQNAEDSRNLIDDPDLKLDMQETLDHENFSKLLELDSKNDDDLFSSADLLDHEIHEDLGKLVQDTTNALQQSEHTHSQHESPTTRQGVDGDIEPEGLEDQQYRHNQQMQQEVEQELQQSRSTPSHSMNDLSLDSGQDSSPLPGDPSSIKENIYNSGTLSAGAGTREDTPASIFESRDEHNFIDTEKEEPLSPSKFQPMSLPPAPLPENAVNKQPLAQPNETSQLPMIEFHDGALNEAEQSKISAYARLDFQSFTFYVQTLQVIIGRRSENDFSHKVDVNLGPSKSISRRHAQIFYNFGTGRFELSIMGKNGAFVDDTFVERGITVQLKNKAKVQIGQIPFQFVLPEQEGKEKKPVYPADADPLKSALNNNNKLTEISRSSTPVPLDVGESLNPILEESKVLSSKKKTPPKKKDKKEPKPPKPAKKVYTLEEIPLEYRTKPAGSYSNLITSCLRKYSSPKGMSLSGIYAGIRELFPYYKYCPDGWQSSVRHNLSLNKSFRKVSKEGKGWLWGLNEEYIAEREKQKKKQAEAAAMKAKAAQLKLEQQQEQKAKKAASIGEPVSAVKSISTVPMMRPKPRQPNISQTLAANRADRKATADGNQRTMKYLQEQLMILTKDRKGLDKHVMASILTQALAMTINQVTQAAKTKGITGNPLTALIDKNPQHLNLILAAAVNAATVKVTNGSVKQLVSMPPPTASPATGHSNPPVNSSSILSTSNSPSHFTPPASLLNKSSDSFDPSSLSKFFQPKQPPRIATPNPTKSVVPLKRPSSETESSSEDDSGSEDDSDSDGSDDSDSSDGSGNEESSSGKESSSDNGSSEGE
ncbi:LANO_0D08878g1_1 [Lachancea nothofagi CBS 11611]|uniref:LANO_0D08878g1_1 n=1 Tax=Lachancea nothofagi CBS 11611 TaxID=1266666 RepID=A0A1G4JJ81_9SACH|nr:LANO_0D08878g1_1 [Lachancea nothofagi CBS 11611]